MDNQTHHQAPGRLFTQSFVVDVVVVDMFRRCSSLRSVADNAGSEYVRAQLRQQVHLVDDRDEDKPQPVRKTGVGAQDKLQVNISCVLSHRRGRHCETTEIAADLLQGIPPKHITAKGGGEGWRIEERRTWRLAKTECERKGE